MFEFKVDKNDQQKAEKMRDAIMDSRAHFWFRATKDYVKKLMLNNHPIIRQLPEKFKIPLIAGESILFDNQMILRYVLGTLDRRNTFNLDNGEIFVTFENLGLESGVTRETTGLDKFVLHQNNPSSEQGRKTHDWTKKAREDRANSKKSNGQKEN